MSLYDIYVIKKLQIFNKTQLVFTFKTKKVMFCFVGRKNLSPIQIFVANI